MYIDISVDASRPTMCSITSFPPGCFSFQPLRRRMSLLRITMLSPAAMRRATSDRVKVGR